MEREVEVVYRDGVLMPLEPLKLAENLRMTVTLHLPAAERAQEILAAAQRVFADLSDEDIAEIEAIALDRSHFMSQRE